MKKTMQKVTACLSGGSHDVLFDPPALAAEDATEKEEIVYANLSSTGQVQAIYVVNAFELGTAPDHTRLWRLYRKPKTFPPAMR